MENIDWNNLGFGYIKTDFNIRCSIIKMAPGANLK
jgi:hypothetical protein